MVAKMNGGWKGMYPEISLGATCLGQGRYRFLVWAPRAQKVEVRLVWPDERLIPLEKNSQGYHHAIVENVEPSTQYLFRLDGDTERPDPASRSQPRGVHAPSELVSSHFPWNDACWFGLPLEDYILYELHVGTFTSEGTFDAVIPYLDSLKELGITAVELMPVAQFPGNRNWGYDGTYPYAVQNSYGGPQGLKRLVNACHRNGMAVVLDVVYNHFGPEGNYLADFGPYFTDRYKTPWGAAVNFDGPHSDHVRRFFLENALYWITEFHIDALRIDAVHAIFDFSAKPFLEELALAVHQQGRRLNRRIHLIAESALNDPRLVRPRELGGYNLDAQWNDDFHHALHTLLTGEKSGYYQDFGKLRHLAKAYREGFVYSGDYSAFRRRRHGNSSCDIPARRFVVFTQNHDQIGNRMRGERLSALISLEGLKLAGGSVFLSPFIPLIFMGEEYGETAPFPYFISHSDRALIENVRQGRRQEFAAFKWQGEPSDPQDEKTFLQAKLNHHLRHQGHHRILFDFYKELIRIRQDISALAASDKEQMEVWDLQDENVIILKRWSASEEVVVIFNFKKVQATVNICLPSGRWKKRLDSAENRWQGPGSLVADEILSSGQVELDLQPYACLLLISARER
jgi:maltooligosyltrehalose trehalohydrolase